MEAAGDTVAENLLRDAKHAVGAETCEEGHEQKNMKILRKSVEKVREIEVELKMHKQDSKRGRLRLLATERTL